MKRRKRGVNETLLKREMQVASFMAWEKRITGQ